MGAETKIEWASSTVNVWEGCAKVSPACKHCYAETNSPVRAMEMRIGEALGVEPSADGKRRLKMWGPNGFRYETSNWEAQLRAMNRKAQRIGKRPRVFINSLSDTFEDWSGPVYRLDDGKPVVVAHSLDSVRARFFRVAEECAELDILLLTKRPENVLGMVPGAWQKHFKFADPRVGPGGYIVDAKWPSHVWLGATVENQEMADKRIPELLRIPARVRFLSMEPLLEEVYLFTLAKAERHGLTSALDWVIVGGESGKNARPMHPDWVRKVRDQCVAAGVPFFFKQWGEWVEGYPPEQGLDIEGYRDKFTHTSDPAMNKYRRVGVRKVGKKNAGRLLDGELWSEVPGESF